MPALIAGAAGTVVRCRGAGRALIAGLGNDHAVAKRDYARGIGSYFGVMRDDDHGQAGSRFSL